MFNIIKEKNDEYTICSVNVESRQLEKIDKICKNTGVNRSKIFRESLSFCLQFFDEEGSSCTAEKAKEIMEKMTKDKK